METQVLIIGGGVTGTGLVRDLTLRGVSCLLVERQDINAGASGGNHGLLHSGARYIASDPAAAAECRIEGRRLKQLAAHCIEETGGLFVAVSGDDESYIAEFPHLCRKAGIVAQSVDVKIAREMEPVLGPDVIAAYAVEDATIDPFRLSLDNLACAHHGGAKILRYHMVTEMVVQNKRIRKVFLRHTLSGETVFVSPELVVNAAGAWAGNVAAMAGACIDMLCSKGSLLVTQNRLSQRVLNRLRPPADGDILVPGGTVSILGTTSQRVSTPDERYPEIHEVDRIIHECAAMAPVLARTRYIRAYCGVRPLLGGDAADDRNISRGFTLIDHALQSPSINNFITITGGKLTTYRLMAEKTADLACRRLGIAAVCRTQTEPLPDAGSARWTEPGLAPGVWLKNKDPDDFLLCECEMVSQRVVEEIVAAFKKRSRQPGLTDIGLRSRVGKGPCQGMFCCQRVAAYLYDRGHWTEDCRGRGVQALRDFLRERWRGQQALLWDLPLAQAELLEAMHCGLFGLELNHGDNTIR